MNVHNEEEERKTQKAWYYYWKLEDVCDLEPESPWLTGRGAWIARGDARQRDERGSMSEVNARLRSLSNYTNALCKSPTSPNPASRPTS